MKLRRGGRRRPRWSRRQGRRRRRGGRERKGCRERFRRGFRARPRWCAGAGRPRAPLASVGPTPPVSSADATCRNGTACGSLFAFAGGGGGRSRGSRWRRARAGPRAAESGLMFWDEDMATAADAADEAAEMAASETSACATLAQAGAFAARTRGRPPSRRSEGTTSCRQRRGSGDALHALGPRRRRPVHAQGRCAVGDGELRVGDARRQGEGEGGGDVPQGQGEDRGGRREGAPRRGGEDTPRATARPRTALRGRRGASTAVRDDDDDDVDDARMPAKCVFCVSSNSVSNPKTSRVRHRPPWPPRCPRDRDDAGRATLSSANRLEGLPSGARLRGRASPARAQYLSATARQASARGRRGVDVRPTSFRRGARYT